VLTDDEIIDGVLKAEGDKFTNDPADRGGPTKYGITAKTLGKARELGRDATADEVAALTEPESRKIYRALFIYEPGFGNLINTLTRASVVDCCVLHGQNTATRMLQRALLVKDDAQLGPKTLAAANAVADGPVLARRVQYDRLRFIGRIITDNLTDADKDGVPDNVEFAKGWVNRVVYILERLEVA